jgi:hypothetical protein
MLSEDGVMEMNMVPIVPGVEVEGYKRMMRVI